MYSYQRYRLKQLYKNFGMCLQKRRFLYLSTLHAVDFLQEAASRRLWTHLTVWTVWKMRLWKSSSECWQEPCRAVKVKNQETQRCPEDHGLLSKLKQIFDFKGLLWMWTVWGKVSSVVLWFRGIAEEMTSTERPDLRNQLEFKVILGAAFP